jgi:hypothetical protein
VGPVQKGLTILVVTVPGLDIFQFLLSAAAWGLYGRIRVAIVVYVLILGLGVAMQNVVGPQGQGRET